MSRFLIVASLVLFAMLWMFCGVIGALDLLQHAGVIPPAHPPV